MRPFKLETRFYILFTLITLVPAVWLARVLQNLVERNLSFELIKSMATLGVMEAPTALSLIALLFWIYKSFLWRIWPFRQLHNVPDIAGRYQGKVESSFDNNKYPIAVEIRQNLLSISVCLYTSRSSSYSIIANVGQNERNNQFLAYIYKNTPRTVTTDLDMRVHDGFACLEIFGDEKRLEGFYYNDPRERGTHGKLSCTWVKNKLRGRFQE